MSFRGGGRGFATGANRGGNFGGRGGEQLSWIEVGEIRANEIFIGQVAEASSHRSAHPRKFWVNIMRFLIIEKGDGWLIMW